MLKVSGTNWWWAVALFFAASAGPVWGSSGLVDPGHGASDVFLWIALLLLFAKGSSVIERWRQPSVLGELVIGIALGNLGIFGIHYFEMVRENQIIVFLAELGVVLLLFQIGLESNIQKMRHVGVRALLVAVVGVVVPFMLGTYAVGPWLLPGLPFNAYLFLGATLTATSVGITARVFRDLGKLQTREAQIVLGAAVIDDVLGLIILAVVSAVVTVGSISVSAIVLIAGKAVLFLAGAIAAGHFLASHIGRLFSRVHAGVGMKLTLAVVSALALAHMANLVGLAPIVGAFAAGLVLEAVHFRYFEDSAVVSEVRKFAENTGDGIKAALRTILNRHADRHVEDLIEPLSHFLTPIFFVVTGMNVNLKALYNPQILGVALGITALAVIGKVVAGAVAGGGNKLLVGVGMVPRGEVGLIFASIGKGLGVVNDAVFSIIIIVVIATTLVTPPVLAWLLRRTG